MQTLLKHGVSLEKVLFYNNSTATQMSQTFCYINLDITVILTMTVLIQKALLRTQLYIHIKEIYFILPILYKKIIIASSNDIK